MQSKLVSLAALSLLMAIPRAHANVLEPLATAMASNRSNDFATPPWKVLNSLPGVKWKAEPEKVVGGLRGVMILSKPVEGVPRTLELTIEGGSVGFHRADILGSVKHGEKNAGTTTVAFSPKIFGRASVRRIFTTCDDDGVASMMAHYAVEYDGHRPIYVGFDSGVGNAGSTMMWRLHLTEAAMLAASGPTCERKQS